MFGFKKKSVPNPVVIKLSINPLFNPLFPNLDETVKKMLADRPVPEIDTLMNTYMNARYQAK